MRMLSQIPHWKAALSAAELSNVAVAVSIPLKHDLSSVLVCLADKLGLAGLRGSSLRFPTTKPGDPRQVGACFSSVILWTRVAWFHKFEVVPQRAISASQDRHSALPVSLFLLKCFHISEAFFVPVLDWLSFIIV